MVYVTRINGFITKDLSQVDLRVIWRAYSSKLIGYLGANNFNSTISQMI